MKDRRRRKHAAQVNYDRWLISYADFVTLLFAFFVVLYASAQIDRQRAVRLSTAIDSAFQQMGIFSRDPHKPGEIDPKLSLPSALDTAQDLPRWATHGQYQLGADQDKQFHAIRSELEDALAGEIRRNEVALRMQADGLVLSLREMGFFDSGSAALKPGAKAAFARIGRILQAHACAARIEGHTDNVPIHTAQFASNWELSTARATGLVRLLIEDYGVPAERLSAAGFAEFHPVADNRSAQGRQDNRRVDIVILRLPPPPPTTSPAKPNSATPSPAYSNGRPR